MKGFVLGQGHAVDGGFGDTEDTGDEGRKSDLLQLVVTGLEQHGQDHEGLGERNAEVGLRMKS